MGEPSSLSAASTGQKALGKWTVAAQKTVAVQRLKGGSLVSAEDKSASKKKGKGYGWHPWGSTGRAPLPDTAAVRRGSLM